MTAPTPLEQKRALGNPGKRPLPAQSATLAVERIPLRPPRGLGLGPDGRKMWTHVAELKWVATTDVGAVVNVCRIADMAAQLDKDVADRGVSYEFRGRLMPNPSVGKAIEARKVLGALLGQFGMTPADRTRLGIAEVKAQSKFDELMERRGR